MSNISYIVQSHTVLIEPCSNSSSCVVDIKLIHTHLGWLTLVKKVKMTIVKQIFTDKVTIELLVLSSNTILN